MLPMIVLCGTIHVWLNPVLQPMSDPHPAQSQVDGDEVGLVPVMLNELLSSRTKSPKSHIGQMEFLAMMRLRLN